MFLSLERFLELGLLIKNRLVFLLKLIAFLAWTVAVAAAEFHDIAYFIFVFSALAFASAFGIVLYFSYWLSTYICFWCFMAFYPTYRRISNIRLKQFDRVFNSQVFGRLNVEVYEEKQQIVAMLYISPCETIFWDWYADIEETRPKHYRKLRKQTLKPANRRFTDEERKLHFEKLEEILPLKLKKIGKFILKKKPNQGKAPSAIRKTKKSVRL